MELLYYITVKELKKGGRECTVSKIRPEERYVKVLRDTNFGAGRGINVVYFKNTELASEWRNGPAGSDWENAEIGPTIGLLNTALRAGESLGLM